MKVIYGIGKVEKTIKNAVLAIGVFDGLHLGHQKLIKAAAERAKLLGGPVIVMTFSPHPVQVLQPDNYLPFIVSLSHRFQLLERSGVTICIVVRFTKRFSQLTAQQFIKRYLVNHIRPKEVFVGEDFRFGQKRQGTISYFQDAGCQYGFTVNPVSPVRSGGKKIGSSRIRYLIAQGKLRVAERFLGRPISVMGKVVKGDGRGRVLGFPTANIRTQNELILPVGVYAVQAHFHGQTFKGMANVGYRPSFKKKNSPVGIEVHVFDFKKNLYGKEIVVEFTQKIRNEKVFCSKDQMSAQLRRDEVKSRSILTNL
jgi:riboflavin kinase/FMN adenylyltransferase